MLHNHILDIRLEFGRVHHVHLVTDSTYRNVAVVGNAGLGALAALLRRDDDHTVRSAATVNGSSRSVLQHGERLDVVRVDQRKRVRGTLQTVVVHGQTVDDNQRVVGCVERRAATDADCGTATRLTAVVDDVHTGHLALQGILCARNQTVVHLVGLDGRDRTGQVVLLGASVTDDHHVLQRLSVVLQRHCYIGGSIDDSFLVADIAHRDLVALISFDNEVTVEIGNCSRRLSNDTHGSADNGFAGSILHMAVHSDLLCEGRG